MFSFTKCIHCVNPLTDAFYKWSDMRHTVVKYHHMAALTSLFFCQADMYAAVEMVLWY